jgi:hypothetical protein
MIKLEEAVEKACKEKTLLDALTFICIWECGRAINQARFNYGSGANGAGWDTCFKLCLESVMNKWKELNK